MPLRLRASPSRRRALSAGQRKTSLQLSAVSFQQKGTRGVVYQGTASAVPRDPLYSVIPSEAGLFAKRMVQRSRGTCCSPRSSSGADSKAMPYTVPKLKDFSAKALDSAVEKLLSALEKEFATLKNADDRKAFRDRWLARKDGILTQINDLWLKP